MVSLIVVLLLWDLAEFVSCCSKPSKMRELRCGTCPKLRSSYVSKETVASARSFVPVEVISMTEDSR